MKIVNLKISQMLDLLESYLDAGAEYVDLYSVNTPEEPNRIKTFPSAGNSMPEEPTKDNQPSKNNDDYKNSKVTVRLSYITNIDDLVPTIQ